MWKQRLFRVGKAIVAKGVKVLLNAASGGIAGDAFELAQCCWEAIYCEGQEQQATAALQDIAQAADSEVVQQAPQIVQEIAPDWSEEDRRHLSDFLMQMPATTRRSLRRPSDPSGKSIPSGLVLRKAEDLLPYLPTRLLRFKAGDFPLPSVDLELVELLGVGGFGEVWKARNPNQRNSPPVALKFCLDPAAAKSLRHEVALLDRVKSQGTESGIVKLLDTYLRADPPCLEYEYIAGGELTAQIREWHRSKGGVSPQLAAAVIKRLADIVGFAHRLKPPIVHRDLKPANILVQKNAENKLILKVADFGIGGIVANQALADSCGTTTRALIAATVAQGSYTPHYASRQQMDGKSADPRDDVYALGVIWYQILTGDLSRGCPSGSRWLERLIEQGMHPPMGKLLESCFEDDPADRPPDAKALADQLSSVLSDSKRVAGNVPAKDSSSISQNTGRTTAATGVSRTGAMEAEKPDTANPVVTAAVNTGLQWFAAPQPRGDEAELRTCLFRFEAMNTAGEDVKDVVTAANEEEAQQKIRQMGYFVTKITPLQDTAKQQKAGAKAKTNNSEAVRLDAKVEAKQMVREADEQDEGISELETEEEAEEERKSPKAAEQAEAERQRRHRPRGFGRRLGGAIFGLAVVGPILGSVTGEVLRLLTAATDWMFGTNVCEGSNYAIQQTVARLLGDKIELALASGSYRLHIDLGGEANWLMVSGSVLGAAVMAVYGWVAGWYANADRDGSMRWWEAILGATIPGPFLGVVIAVVLRAIGGVIAWPFGWEIGGYLTWMKWGAIVCAIGFWMEGWTEGWTAANYGAGPRQRHFWRRVGSALMGAAIGAFLGVLVGTVLRGIGGLIAWPFGWEIGGWLIWLGWAAMPLIVFMVIFWWNEEM